MASRAVSRGVSRACGCDGRCVRRAHGVERACVDGRACVVGARDTGRVGSRAGSRIARDPTAEGYRGRDARDGGRGCVCARVCGDVMRACA